MLAVRKAANDAAPRGDGRLSTDMQFTVGGKKTIDMGDARTSTDHLLLALATVESSTSTVLQSAGFQSDAVVKEMRKMRDEEG